MELGTFLKDVSDPYSRRARLYPGLIVLLPITMLAIVVFTTTPAWWSAAVVVAGGSGTAYFGAQLVRAVGKRHEQALWASWGGAPTTQMLRFAGAANLTAVQRRHDLLARVLPDLPVADRVAEAADPQLADDQYMTAVDALIARTRDKAHFPRVFDELRQYGFRRNLLGCRTIGRSFAAAGFFLAFVALILNVYGILEVSTIGLLLAICMDVVLFGLLEFVVTPDWVRAAGDAYARQLLETLEVLAVPTEAPGQRAAPNEPDANTINS